MGFVIRPATEDDLPQMLRLWREMMDFHAECDRRFRPGSSPEAEQAWTKHLREDIWPSDRWCALVAEVDGRLVGQILGELRETLPVFEAVKFGYVTDIVVDPQARRRRIGEALFQALKAWFAQRGTSHLRLQVAHHNPASQAFWREMGCTDYMDTLWYDLEAK
ncbi:MAG: GNAT family N-acetyltransferase [Anaerolineae bacterium]|jgi:ribosomal protein S18 acetylase RimI-like enzyme